MNNYDKDNDYDNNLHLDEISAESEISLMGNVGRVYTKL